MRQTQLANPARSHCDSTRPLSSTQNRPWVQVSGMMMSYGLGKPRAAGTIPRSGLQCIGLAESKSKRTQLLRTFLQGRRMPLFLACRFFAHFCFSLRCFLQLDGKRMDFGRPHVLRRVRNGFSPRPSTCLACHRGVLTIRTSVLSLELRERIGEMRRMRMHRYLFSRFDALLKNSHAVVFKHDLNLLRRNLYRIL